MKPVCPVLSKQLSLSSSQLQNTLPAKFLRHYVNSSAEDSRASAKLFADAVREEEAEQETASKSSQASILESQHENWTGDESIKDAVLRMLVDKYKPLRYGTIQTAEEKLKRSPPKISTMLDASSTARVAPLKPASGSWGSEPLLPSIEGHKPWHTTYKAPSHESPSVKLAHIPPPIISTKPSVPPPIDEKARRLQKENLKRTQQAGRLNQARESTLDYRLGVKNARLPAARPNPVGMKGWTSLVEDRIEKARQAGLFKDVKGRGKPLLTVTEERNPFIAREEFLMNRIVKRNGATPPWVEIQKELDTALDGFRQLLRQSWIRRAVRILALEHPLPILQKMSLAQIQAFRDPEWAKKEQSYHDAAIAELNSLVRKHNGMAPYAVRRPYYLREVEISRLYEDCAEDIYRSIAERRPEEHLLSHVLGGGEGRSGADNRGSEPESSVDQYHPEGSGSSSFLLWLRTLFQRLFKG